MQKKKTTFLEIIIINDLNIQAAPGLIITLIIYVNLHPAFVHLNDADVD